MENKNEEIEKELREERANALANKDTWVEEGKQLIYPQREEEWEKCVDSCINGVYIGEDVAAALEIMKGLEEGCSIEEAKETLKSQDHSGGSEYVVNNIVFHFSKRGPEYIEEVWPNMDETSLAIVEQVKEENRQFEQEKTKSM